MYKAFGTVHQCRGSYPALSRYLHDMLDVPPRRAVRPIEPPLVVRAQHGGFDCRVDVGDAVIREVGLPLYAVPLAEFRPLARAPLASNCVANPPRRSLTGV